MSDPFAEIRPYRDEEVTGVLDRLLHDPEFLDALARLRMGNLGLSLANMPAAASGRILARKPAAKAGSIVSNNAADSLAFIFS